jgi:teichuronic acid biosynthesis glycosyltransferase TuaC
MWQPFERDGGSPSPGGRGGDGRGGQGVRSRLLVFSTVFPNSAQPHHGVFVRERMRGLPEDVEVCVVAPVAWFPFVSGLRPG